MSKMLRYIILATAFVLVLPSILFVMGSTADHGTRGEIGGVFVGDEIYRSSRSLSGGMSAGDPDRDGDLEVVFCDFEGNVIVLEPRGDGGFDPIFVWQVEGPQGSNKTLFDLIVADVDPDKEGQEIITAGDAGSPLKEIYMIHYNGTGWEAEVIHRSTFRTFDLELGDIDPAPGEEILFGSFKHEEDYALHYLYRDAGVWKEKSIPTTEAVKAITVADADPLVEGKEIWACIAGWNSLGGVESHLVEIYRSGDSWKEEIIYSLGTELISNVRIGELWSQHEGNEIIITELSGWCRVLYWEDGEFRMEDIFQADTISGQSSGLEGLAIGDFNPAHAGDEAMVTGYYNKVTQIIEVEGNIVADEAWHKEVEDPRLEISGVEVVDVTDDHPGNEVMVASLQGWIEMLRFQDDGIGLKMDSTIIEIEDGGDKTVFLEVAPEGRYTGSVVVTAVSSPGLTVTFNGNVDLLFQDPEFISVKIEPDELGSERTSYVNFTVSGGGHTAEFSLTVEVVVQGDAELAVTPQTGRIYREGINTFNAQVTLVGGSRYDYVDLAATSVDGLAINVNTPISPGESNDITVSVVGNPSLGAHTVSITGLYNGVTAAQGSFIINVISFESSLAASMRTVQGERNKHLINLNFSGAVPVSLVEIEMTFGERSLYKMTRDLSAGDSIAVPFTVEKDEEGDVMVTVRSLSGDVLFGPENLGTIVYEEKEDGGMDAIDIAIIVLLVLIVGVLLYFVLSKVAGQKKEETDEGDLKAIYGTSPYGRPRRGPPEVRGGRMDRERLPPRERGPPREEVRRAPPRYERDEEVPRGEVRRAPPAPDHLRPGGRQRDVMRAPPAPDHLRPGGGREVRRAPPRRF
ncbi:MAG: hypothetical protein ACMUHU_04915 [Thermoplasmatota archaeon]